MLKRLALNYWPLILLVILIVVVLGVSRYAENRKTQNAENCQAGSPKTPISPGDAGRCAENANKPHRNPDWIDTFTWPEGATVWALFLTLLVIAWQSTETRKAANASLEQARLTVEKERARLYVRPGILESFWDRGTENWAFRVRLEVENSGNSRAYGIGGEIDGRGCIWIQGVSAPIAPRLKLPWMGSARYLSAGVFSTTLDSQLLSVTPDTIEGALYGDQAIFLQGFVKYETLGKRFCKRYGYRWWTGSFDRTGLNFGNRFIEGRWLEDDQQDNGETEIP